MYRPKMQDEDKADARRLWQEQVTRAWKIGAGSLAVAAVTQYRITAYSGAAVLDRATAALKAQLDLLEQEPQP